MGFLLSLSSPVPQFPSLLSASLLPTLSTSDFTVLLYSLRPSCSTSDFTVLLYSLRPSC